MTMRTATHPRQRPEADRRRSRGGIAGRASFRDEVLAPLLELNEARAEPEKLTVLPAAKPKKARTRRKKASNSYKKPGTDSEGTPDLF